MAVTREGQYENYGVATRFPNGLSDMVFDFPEHDSDYSRIHLPYPLRKCLNTGLKLFFALPVG